MTYLLKFLKIGGHHSREDFAVRGKEPKDEVQIYTWKDATLRELTDLVRSKVHGIALVIFTTELIPPFPLFSNGGAGCSRKDSFSLKIFMCRT